MCSLCTSQEKVLKKEKTKTVKNSNKNLRRKTVMVNATKYQEILGYAPYHGI